VAQPPAPPKPAKPAPLPVVQPETPKADIVLAKEKLRLKKEKQDALDAQRQNQLKLEKADKVEKLKQEKLDKLKQDKLDKEKALLEAKKKGALDAKRKEALKAEQEKLENQKIEIQREANLKRIAGLAGATGGADAKGSAQKSSGTSAGYSSRLAALFRKNINFPSPESLNGNPKATVEVRVSATGLILSSRLLTSSGVTAWDNAVLRAVEKTERIPADENGSFVSVFPVNFGPKD
jgi:colicin import membrane protein